MVFSGGGDGFQVMVVCCGVVAAVVKAFVVVVMGFNFEMGIDNGGGGG